MNVKQVLVVRKDLNMRKGKIAAQCAHASMKVLLDACYSPIQYPQLRIATRAAEERFLSRLTPEEILDLTEYVTLEGSFPVNEPWGAWLSEAFAKVVVSVDSEHELDEIYHLAKLNNIPTALIVDSGRTEFHGVPTKTVVAVGPALSTEIDKITGHLKLL